MSVSCLGSARWREVPRDYPDVTKDMLMPGLDSTRLFFGLTAGAGTRCMTLLSSPPSLCHESPFIKTWELLVAAFDSRLL